jgi:hypothetical protein
MNGIGTGPPGRGNYRIDAEVGLSGAGTAQGNRLVGTFDVDGATVGVREDRNCLDP